MEHFRPQNVLICSRLFSCDSIAHCIKRSPDLRFLCSLVLLQCLLLFMYSKREREEKNLTFFFCMYYQNSGYIGFFVAVDELDLVG